MPQGQPRKLVLCFDGTWNTIESQTNVSRIFKAVSDEISQCPHQKKFYEEGVGTKWGEKLRGGMLGLGLGVNVLRGYSWLVNNYEPGTTAADAADPDNELFSQGNEIFLFGFSRGAFTARSLAGLINRVGILDRSLLKAPASLDTQEVKDAWNLYRENYTGAGSARDAERYKSWRQKHSHTARIKFVGVWDTVGALGVPGLRAALPMSAANYRFHDQNLGKVIENAYHAVAMDENRKDYNVVLWKDRHRMTKELEQRWFPGAHSNVGGGYEGDLLPDAPLLWMAKKAAALGLEFNADMATAMATGSVCIASPPAAFALDGEEYLSPVRDSYGEFLWGAYRAIKTLTFQGRFYRRMLVQDDGLDQQVDETARFKWEADTDYRPRNLAQPGRIDTAAAGPVRLLGA
jgi:uncharacterized protein (DUF2235 family)